MKSVLVSFLSGVVFAIGLGISGMTQPAKIIGFLDFTGNWDPSLACVVTGAITVAVFAMPSGSVPHELTKSARHRLPAEPQPSLTPLGVDVFRADADGPRPAPGRRRGPFRSRLGYCWFLPWAGADLASIGSAVGYDLCRGHDRGDVSLHADRGSVAAAPGARARGSAPSDHAPVLGLAEPRRLVRGLNSSTEEGALCCFAN